MSSDLNINRTLLYNLPQPQKFDLSVSRKVIIVASLLFSTGGVLASLFVMPQGSLYFWLLVGSGNGSFVVFSSVVIYSCVQWRQMQKASKIQRNHLNTFYKDQSDQKNNRSSLTPVIHTQNLNSSDNQPNNEETPPLQASNIENDHSDQISQQPLISTSDPNTVIKAVNSNASVLSSQLQDNNNNLHTLQSKEETSDNTSTSNETSSIIPIIEKPNLEPVQKELNAKGVSNVKPVNVTSQDIKNINGEQASELKTKDQTSLWKAINKAVTNASEYVMSGGVIQKRAYQFLLYPIIDEILNFLTNGIIKYDQITPQEKIIRICEYIEKKASEFSFLLTPHEERSNLQGLERCLWKSFYYLSSIDSSNASTNRKKFNQWLQKARETSYYKDNVAAFCEEIKKTSPQEAKIKYPLIAFIFSVANAMFTQVHLHTLADEAVFEILHEGYEKLNSRCHHWKPDVSLKEAITADFKAIHSAPASEKSGTWLFNAFNKLKGHFNIWFDPVNSNNYISVLWKDVFIKGTQEHTVECLRFGTPTIETFNNPEIIAQMHYFLNSCVANNHIFVSFQHQNIKEKSFLGGNEALRLQKMLELNDDPFYEKHVFVFGLPMDNEFFHQTGCYETQSSVELFKKQFFSLIVDKVVYKDKGFFIPINKLKNNGLDYLTDIKEIINTVHTLFFPREPGLNPEDIQNLSPQERTIFQLITYLFFEDYFVTALNARYFHSQCKDAQDRAMVILALQFYMRMIKMGQEKDPAYLRQFRVLIHHAALFIKGDAMHGGRAKLLVDVLDFLQKKDDSQKLAIKNYHMKHTVNNVESHCVLKQSFIEWIPNQSIHLLPYEATSLDEYHQYIDQESGKEQYLPISNFSNICYKENLPQTLNSDLLTQYLKDIERQDFMIDDERLSLELKSHQAHLCFSNLYELYLINELSIDKFPKLTPEIFGTLIMYNLPNSTLDDFSIAVRSSFSDKNVEISEDEIKKIAQVLLNNPYRGKKDILSFKLELSQLKLSQEAIEEIYKSYKEYGDIHHEFFSKLTEVLNKENKIELVDNIKNIISHLKANEYYSYIFEKTDKNSVLTAQIIGYSDQKMTQDMTAVINQRYNAKLKHPKYVDTFIEMQIVQRKFEGKNNQANTLSNIKFYNGKPVIEIRQMWQIFQDMEYPIYSIRSQLLFEIEKDLAVMSWTPPQTEALELYESLDEDSFSLLLTSQHDEE